MNSERIDRFREVSHLDIDSSHQRNFGAPLWIEAGRKKAEMSLEQTKKLEEPLESKK